MRAYESLSKDAGRSMRVSWPGGTVVNMSIWAFFKLDNSDMQVSNTGRFHTSEELAAILKNCVGPIRGVDACDLHR